ncbi:ABC-F family ATP-binding cassette domain-containing protein [Enterococcus faecium]|uniref:ribosomal protection-like ABC-F family protein n=1 Tax=Enterococcus faecium TaxID=1352 RepID=UPI00232EC174|nr:ABC-F family ATP-binding cassette domain-containing protein [Enterococcus faecium]MDB1171808.1 ABC-F family ATP-binding cassette domain-containing protein [Enterococcus faecium]
MIIQAISIKKTIGGNPLFEDLSCQIEAGEKIALVGINGTGKSTFLQILTGREGVDSGVISRKKGLKIGTVEQELTVSEATANHYLLHSAAEIQDLKQQMSRYEALMTEPDTNLEKCLARYGELQHRFEELGGYVLEDRIAAILQGLGIPHRQEARLTELSGGERVKVALAKILAADADLLLLDEPTNHLDLNSIRWLENYLQNTKKSVLVVSHDRQFLDQVTTKTWELEEGALIEYPGNYSRFRVLKEARLAELTKNYELQQKEVQRLKVMIRRFRQWAHEGDNESFFKKAKELERRLAKLTLVKPPPPPKNRLQSLSNGGKSGKEVFIIQNLHQQYADQVLFKDSSFAVYRGDHLAIIGDNGAGKSTLLKLLLGEEKPYGGTIKLGSSLQIGYLPQQLQFADPDSRLLAYAITLTGNEEVARRQLAKSGFYQSDVGKRIKDLSGGEKIRLALLKLFLEKINVLILDEPTNHLDSYAREEIEEMLQDYQGTLLAVSHDRYFLQQHFQEALVIDQEQISRQPLGQLID